MLGGLRYSKEILRQLLREEIMRESVTYQDLLAKGVQQGTQQGELDLALRLLRRKFGDQEAHFIIPNIALFMA